MKNVVRRMGMFIYFSVATFVLLQLNAHAYIDPSTVSIMVQAIAGVVIAIGAGFTIFRHKIVAFFKKGSDEKEKREIHFNDDEDSAEDKVEE